MSDMPLEHALLFLRHEYYRCPMVQLPSFAATFIFSILILPSFAFAQNLEVQAVPAQVVPSTTPVIIKSTTGDDIPTEEVKLNYVKVDYDPSDEPDAMEIKNPDDGSTEGNVEVQYKVGKGEKGKEIDPTDEHETDGDPDKPIVIGRTYNEDTSDEPVVEKAAPKLTEAIASGEHVDDEEEEGSFVKGKKILLNVFQAMQKTVLSFFGLFSR